MRLTIESQTHDLVPIDVFRDRHALPAAFEVAAFEPETLPYNRVWSQEREALAAIGEQVLATIPARVPAADATEIPQRLAFIFEHALVEIAPETDLEREELEITVTDFRNVLEAAAYKLVELYYLNAKDAAAAREQFDVQAVYQDALDSSVRLEAEGHTYETAGGQTWTVHVIFTQFGAVGLQVQMDAQTVYVEDQSLAFPAADFIEELCLAAGNALCAAFVEA